MLNRVAQFIARHRIFETGQRVGVAVSGGADSMFLLHALHELGPRWNLKLSVVHVEHGIRGEASKADAEFVRGLASRFALPFHIRSVSIPAAGGNLEQAARNARRDFFAELIGSGLLDRVATGHTHNDQAETVLYRILRGSGLTGLAAIRPVTEEGLVRPLLELERKEIEAWLRSRNIEWRHDATNCDLSYARNRLRHETLPLLRETFNPRLDQALVHLASLSQDEEQYWNEELERYPLIPAGSPILSTSQLAGLPRAAARRLVRRVIRHVKGDLWQIDYAHVEKTLEVAQSPLGHARFQIPGVEIVRSLDWIRFAPPGFTARAKVGFEVPLRAPSSIELPGSSTRITLQILEKGDTGEACGTVVDELDWQRITVRDEAPSGLELRNWRPGDQYRRVGRTKQEKVKVLFQEARVPLWERRGWPIITYNGTILWVRRFGAAAEFAAGPATRLVLRVGESAGETSNR